VVQTSVKQIQDGGRPPSWKIEKLPYLCCLLTNQHKIWHGEAYSPSELDIKIANC